VVIPGLAAMGNAGALAAAVLVFGFIGGGAFLLPRVPRVRSLPSPLPLTPRQQRRLFLGSGGMIAYTLLTLVFIVMVVLA